MAIQPLFAWLFIRLSLGYSAACRKPPLSTGHQLPNQRSYQTGQCFRFERSGACSKPGCQLKNTWWRQVLRHPTNRSMWHPLHFYDHHTIWTTPRWPPATCPRPYTIHTSALSHYLYADNEQAAPFTLDGLSHGFPLRYDGPRHLRLSQNHKTNQDYNHARSLLLYHTRRLGWAAYRVLSTIQCFANFLASPLGLVLSMTLRLIHHLSFPRDDSINSYTSKEFTTVHYTKHYRFSCGTCQTLWSWQPHCQSWYSRCI